MGGKAQYFPINGRGYKGISIMVVMNTHCCAEPFIKILIFMSARPKSLVKNKFYYEFNLKTKNKHRQLDHLYLFKNIHSVTCWVQCYMPQLHLYT